MTHGSLFSGIGGFDLASSWMGWSNLFHCEMDEFAKRVLQYHFPESTSYGDIRATDFSLHRDTVDVLTGGFPCQPYSAAGKRRGKDDDRHLWQEMLRCVQQVRPRWIVGENVYGIITWNAGMVFDEVCSDLETEGYSVQPYVLPACAVNAPHRRDRVWFVAHANNAGTKQSMRSEQQGQTCYCKQRLTQSECWKTCCDGDATNSSCLGCRGRCCKQRNNGEREIPSRERERSEMGCKAQGCSREWIATDSNCQRYEKFDATTFTDQQARKHRTDNTKIGRNYWEGFPTESPICSRNDGFPNGLDGITFSKWRNQSIKAYGNAIVPQVALQIFRAIEQYEVRQGTA